MALGSLRVTQRGRQLSRLSLTIARLSWRAIYRLSERHDFSDCRVAIFLPDHDARPIIEHKVAEALELLRRHGPRYFERVRTYSEGILVFGETGALGEWTRAARFIKLNQKFVSAETTHAAHVAGTIVHEATHAWLEHHGFTYAVPRRRRIEAICYRSESAFARRVPGGDDLAAYYDKCAETVLGQPDGSWSDEAFRNKSLEQLRELGTPEWLLKAVTRISTTLPNER